MRLLAGAFDLLLPAFCPFAGVPSSQMTLFKGADGKGVVATFIERVFRRTHIATDNYFYYACEAHPWAPNPA